MIGWYRRFGSADLKSNTNDGRPRYDRGEMKVMSPSILGRKVGMTQIFLEDGRAIPVTVIQAGPCHVLQVRSRRKRDGYQAVQLGFEDKPRRLASRSERGHVAKLESKRSKKRAAARRLSWLPKADCEPQRFIREVRVVQTESGSRCDRDRRAVCRMIKRVDVTGTSKGRGLRRCHEASQLLWSTCFARRQEGASPRRWYRLQCFAESAVQRAFACRGNMATPRRPREISS